MTITTSRKVFCIGEIVLDIIFRNNEPVAARAGGSMLNTAVSLGRAGVGVQFIGEIGTDKAGETVLNFLEENRVGISFINQHPERKTTLALAFLDQSGDATYSFYSSEPEQKFNTRLPDPGENDIVLFGSFYSLTAGIRKMLVPFLKKANENRALVVYDPNFRKPHLPQLKQVLPLIRENISLSDIVRGSDEDFIHIFAAGNAEQVLEITGGSRGQTLLYTQNSRGVRILRSGMNLQVPIPQIDPVSTIGAGDAFNAGVIHSLVRTGIRKDNLDALGPEEWKEIAETGIRFSQDVCLSLDNYISEAFATSLKR
jgi:fructokinase